MWIAKNLRYIDKSNAHCGGCPIPDGCHSCTSVGYFPTDTLMKRAVGVIRPVIYSWGVALLTLSTEYSSESTVQCSLKTWIFIILRFGLLFWAKIVTQIHSCIYIFSFPNDWNHLQREWFVLGIVVVVVILLLLYAAESFSKSQLYIDINILTLLERSLSFERWPIK